ncbi:MAG: response regulator transcription factor [Elusimicrobiales bacterium]|nr:response regulator transcription factor [Elusimicrobiales bacterium]
MSVERKSILVVEDDKDTLLIIKEMLEAEGYAVICQMREADTAAYLKDNVPDMAILDVGLPDGSGLDLAKKIRSRPATAHIPIIVLTGLGGLDLKKDAFSTGIDQYLMKPMDIEELVLWVKALFRREELSRRFRHSPCRAGEMQVDKESFLVTYKGRTIKGLTSREFQLLAYLVENSPEVISRERIMKDIWHTVAVENLVDTHIHNLRSKLPESAARRIESVYGRGFRYFNG